jgi:predicted CXXCH cytochrome family protein
MFPALLSATAALLVLAVVWTHPVAARQRPAATAPPPPIAVDIADPVERDAFVRVWQTSDPAVQRDLAVRFVTDYPRTVLLRESYEIAARASLAMGDGQGALTWGERALRLLPENVPLLVMVADLAAKQREQALAERSARAALRLLDTALPPPALPPDQWAAMGRGLRATVHTVLGRVAAERADHAGAERELVTAIGLDPGDQEALYLLGVARLAAGDDDAAAPPLGAVAHGGGPLAANARRLLRAVHGRTPAPAADFDAFVASLRFVPPDPPAATPQPPVAGRYAGSDACRTCHVEQYARWQQTGMARMLRRYRPENVIGDFSSGQTVDGRARAVLDDGRHFIEVRRGESQYWTRYPVDYTIGSKWQQAYATTLDDKRMLVFPIQYSRNHGGWINYWRTVDAPGSARADITQFHDAPQDAIYQTTCAPCHTSQLKFATSADRPEAATFHEGGVNCETCHGPSRAHAEGGRPGQPSPRPAIEPPVRFADLAAAESVAICAQCHAQSAVHDAVPSGEVNFGVRGQWYRVYPTHLVSSFPRRALYRDGRFRATTFISEAFARSRCFQNGQATCASCHDPHPPDAATNPTSLKFAADDDRMCLQCHTSLEAAPERHTRHRAGTAASRCVACHMPRIAEALLFKARSHQIDDIPDAGMTARFGEDDSPNACLACHGDRGLDWLTMALAARRR